MQSQEINTAEERFTPDLAKDKKRKKLTVTLFIGDKRIDKLTPEQSDRMSERLSQVMSRYYSSHIEEFGRMKSSIHTKEQ